MHTALYSLIRHHYRDLQGYVSAGMESGKNPANIYMNANENPYDLPGLEGYNRYPEPQPVALLNAYAALYGVNPAQIVMTRGADEAIVVLTKLFCEPHKDSILICPPTFGMYGVDAHGMPADVIEVPLVRKGETFVLDVKGIIGHCEGSKTQAPKLIYICSPNNPTGTSFSVDDILAICKSVEGRSLVVLDETYIEFARAESLTQYLNSIPNLVILRTLSKSYSMAGMRMGSMLCGDTDFIDLIRRKCLDAYPLPRASIEAALHIMKPDVKAQAHKNIEMILEERERLHSGFERHTLVRQIYKSDANFLLIHMDRAADFIAYCAQHNVILRDFTQKSGTEWCVRISVGLPEENDRVLDLLNIFSHAENR